MSQARSHVGPVLSDLLDGRLRPEALAAVQAHLASCPPCRAELADAECSRRALRSLAPVEPPPGLLERIAAEAPAGPDLAAVLPLRPRPTPARATLVTVAATVAAVLFTVGGGSGAIRPEVAGAVERHASTIAAMGAGGLGAGRPLGMDRLSITPTTATPHRLDDLPAAYQAPPALAGWVLVGGFSAPGGLHLVYERGDDGLSVIQTPGDVDFDELPPGGRRIQVAGADAWQWDAPGIDGRVVVVQHDGMGVVLVGDGSGDDVLEAADALPGPPGMPVVERLRRGCARVLEGLSPTG